MKVLLPALGLLLLFSCKKNDAVTPSAENSNIKFSVDSTHVMPGDAVIIRSDKKVTAQEVNIAFNGTMVKGYAVKDSAYVFYVPVVIPGPVTVSIPGIENSNSIQLTVKDYAPISNPQTVIDDFVDKRNRSIDSITKVVEGSNFQPSPESIVLLNQIKEEWDLQMSRLSPADKNLLAYVLQKNSIDPAAFSFTAMPAGSFTARVSGIQSDVGDKLVATAKEYVTCVVACVASVPVLLTSAGVFLIAPNPVTGIIFLGVLTTFVVTREAANRKAQEVGRLKGVAEAITDGVTERIAAAEFENGQEKEVRLTVKFRNLRSGDAGIQADISSSFSLENEFMTKDQEVKAIYTQAASKLEKLKAPYPSYAKTIGTGTTGSSDMSVDGENIIVKGASDPRVAVSSDLSNGKRKVKLTSTATEEIRFDLEVAYHRSLDGKEFTRNIPCILKPAPSFELKGLWRLYFYSDGSRSKLEQSDLIDFGNGATDPGYTLSYIDHLNGKEYDLSAYKDRWAIQTFLPSTSQLALTHNYWNIYYRFNYDKDNPDILIGESIGASNKGFNMELKKQ